jgi:hypothetical protein
MHDEQQPATRSLEAVYFLRLFRVGAVVLVLYVAGYFVLRTQEKTTPPAPVAEGIPVILLENATIVESPEAIERIVDFVDSTNPAADSARDVLAGQPLVAPTVRVDLPAAPPLSAAPLLAPESTIFETAAAVISTSKSSGMLETSATGAGSAEPEKKKSSGRKP